MCSSSCNLGRYWSRCYIVRRDLGVISFLQLCRKAYQRQYALITISYGALTLPGITLEKDPEPRSAHPCDRWLRTNLWLAVNTALIFSRFSRVCIKSASLMGDSPVSSSFFKVRSSFLHRTSGPSFVQIRFKIDADCDWGDPFRSSPSSTKSP
jgi:hypothetical protein